jgi:hypothetical protein
MYNGVWPSGGCRELGEGGGRESGWSTAEEVRVGSELKTCDFWDGFETMPSMLS